MRHPFFSLAIVAVVTACNVGPAFEDDDSVCADARNLLYRCGVTLALLSTDECSGPSRIVAQCVTSQADSCDGLATIRFDECLADAFDTDGEAPYDPPPVPPPTYPADDGPVDPMPEDSDEACADAIDNDGDGYFDCDDVDCSQSVEITVCGEDSTTSG